MLPIIRRFRDSAEDDANLLQAVRLRDQGAMAAIFDRYASMVFSVAFRVVKDPGTAEDVMQDVLFQVSSGSRAMNPNGVPFGAWLVCVTRNRAIDARRKRRPHIPMKVALQPLVNVAEEAILNTQVEQVIRVIALLPPAARQLMELARHHLHLLLVSFSLLEQNHKVNKAPSRMGAYL
jgi:RNA polymerase sigma-70 factor, ECF subfamily